jgi:hypothetical protein
MGRIYNIVFMSSQGTGTIANRNYYFDFSKLPEGKYTGTFAFVSAAGNFTTSCANVFCDLGFARTYAAATINGSSLSTSTFYIGSVLSSPISNTANCYLVAALPNNAPFSLSNRPTNNNVNIRILNNDANQTAFATELAYTLVISLELQE